MNRSEIVGKNIKKFRSALNMSQVDLADAIGRSQPMVAMYENGQRLPSTQIMSIIAKVLGVSFGALYFSEDEHGSDPFEDDMCRLTVKRIPIIGDTAAGAPIIANREYDEFVDVPIDGRRFDAAVRVKGDSMEPGYRIGDLALIHYQEDVEDGQIAVVCLDDEVTLKRVYHTPTGVILQSDNPKYPAMVVTTEDVSSIHLTGRAIGVLHWED